MSEISVNEHLEGILSDFEALKRSFDAEDADDVPPFSLPSCLSAPVSPLPSHSFLNHNTPSEGRDRSSLSPSLAFNNNNNNSLGPAAHHSCISSSPRPVLKPPNLSSSLSFNWGTAIKPAVHNNGPSAIRASSFQSRFNPNGFSLLSGPGSDNDSLHSSTSSLEYSGGVGASLTLSKPGLCPSVSPQEEFHLPQFPQQAPEGNENFGHKLHLKKFSSYGNVFHSEMDQGSLGAPGPRGSNHCSMPSLDLQIRDVDRGQACTHWGRGGDQMSPGLRHSNASWNGRHVNAAAYGEEGYGGIRNYHPQNVPQMLKVPQLKVKETPRLNKFPLDLDALVSSTSANQVQGRSMSPHQPKPPPRSAVDPLHHPNLLSTFDSSSASLSSLESSSDALASSFQHSHGPVSPRSPTPSQDPIPGPKACSPLAISTDHRPQTEMCPGHQEVPNRSSSDVLPSDRSIYPLQDPEGEAGESVSSILQRIASFSLHTTPEAIPSRARYPPAQSDAGSLSSPDMEPRWRQEVKKQKEASGEPQTGPPVPMEDTQKEKCIMEQVQDDGGTTQEQPPNANDQGSVTVKEGLGAEIMEERRTEKGMDEGELQKEVQLEAELKMELWQPEQGLQLNYIHGSDLVGYVGIEAVLDQMRNKTMKVGFDFNIMVVGQSGLGKSTLVNTLFKSKVSRKSCTPEYEEKIPKTVKLHKISHVIEEKGVKMKLTVIDTPGFGDQINNENCWEPIITYVNEQYEKYLREELYVTRKRRIPDSRVHCCIYFLPASGHRLRSIDIEFMKRLGRIVSIVPVIAKADALTIEERQEFKERIRQDLAANGICVYPQKEYDEDPQERIVNDRIRESIPFAVVGTDKEHQVNGNKVLGRKTKWGIIEVENMEHCEFAYLRDLLIRSHLQDLKDVTHNIHYETYRVRRLNESNINFTEAGLSTWLLEHGTAERSGSDSQL